MGKILGFPKNWVIFAAIIIVGVYYFGGVTQFVNAVIALPTTLLGYLGLSSGGGVGGAAYYGNINFVIAQSNELTGGAAAPTSPVYGLYTSMPTAGAAAKPITVTGSIYEVPDSADGICYIGVFTGTDFFLDWNKVKGMNSYVTDVISTDWDNDSIDEILLKLDVSDIAPINPNQNPTLTISLPLIAEHTVLTVDAPANQVLGAVSVPGEITWTITSFDANEGVVFEKLYVTTNVTGVSGVLQSKGLVLGGGAVASSGAKTSWSLPIYEDTGTTYSSWYVKGGIHSPTNDYDDYMDGLLVWQKASEPDTLTVTYRFQALLTTHCAVTLTFQTVNTEGVISTAVTDTVILADA